MNPLSIGNFFHEDLAYLAALEATGNLTLEIEQKRNAWWKLLLWYLNDDLKVIEQPLKGQPFLNWVPRQGGRGDGAPVFDKISWLDREGKIVGVVSPVLLVRPLPDEHLAGSPWDATAPITERVRGRLTELVKNLDEKAKAKQRNSAPFCCRLSPIISPRAVGPATTTPESEVVLTPFSFLDPYTLESTEILVPTGDGSFLFPRCAECAAPLLPASVKPAPDSPMFALKCPKCQQTRQLLLSDYGCAWADGEFVVWRERALQWADPSKAIRMPPAPIVDRDQATVTFVYPAVSALANLPVRNLTFDLQPGTPFRVIDRLDDLNYSSYLWPGDPDPAAPVAAIPLPVRIENARLVNTGRARKVNNRVEVTLGLKGLPADISWIFLPAASMAGSIAMYPNPTLVPPTWSWFDIATADGLTIQVPSSAKNVRGVGENRIRTESKATELPAFELSNTSSVKASCTVLLSRKETRSGLPPIEFFVGFDFGSSNTALRFSLEGTHSDSHELSGSDLRQAVVGLTVSADFEGAADRLAPKGAADDTSFQSVYCQDHRVARIVSTPCCNSVTRDDFLFKSDPLRAQIRIEYLTEMLIHGLIGASRQVRDRPLNVRGVFSYPLTFTAKRLEMFKGEIASVVERASNRTGGDPATARAKTRFVDEATAGVTSLGQPHAKELVFTADLGGGTLDVSIGRSTDGPAKDQIGSLEVGGSYFLRRGAQSLDLEAYATAAMNIARGKADRKDWARRKPEVDRYYQLLFVALEAFLGSYISRGSQHDPVEKVSLYPLGNGWRFYELMADPMQEEGAAFVKEEIGRLAKNLSAAMEAQHGVKLDLSAHHVNNPKQAVASGCLRVATMAVDSPEKEIAAKLPIGIDSANGEVRYPWHALFVGEAADKKFVNDALEFDEAAFRTRLQTENGKAWATQAFDAGLLRADLQTDEYHSGVRYTRGPLQLLIEKQWLPKV